MNSGHAPGKWRIFAVFADAEVRDSDDKLIAALPSKTGARYARLIASAPDLLAERDRLKAANAELAEALEELLNAHAIPSTGCKERFAHKRAHAALANNKGETE